MQYNAIFIFFFRETNFFHKQHKIIEETNFYEKKTEYVRITPCVWREKNFPLKFIAQYGANLCENYFIRNYFVKL
jgi:hypothetical protein